ncbi:hypothetical protein HBE96_07745 [Clostridium sp. P21]|uniref:Uncharacterized protein n=1 Tax=Clostridium muellerianum TaxID=2716538 RepID=A0A7Y0EFS9_9CLOT|nr:hypothetical protein [Clostridium muellerianum]NMM62586.1 hypothetical protein [Clostridium muellerianum]
MSINIPSYYYTEVGKRVKGESIASLKDKMAKASVNIADNVHNKLDTSKCIDLSTSEGRASVHLSNEELKGIEEAKKHVGKVDLSEIENKPIEYEVVVNNREGRPLDYYNFENCVNSMSELNDNQKTTLRNAIITSTESVNGQQQDSNTFGMRISQTNMELKYISQELVPKQYQEQFNSIVDKYTDKLTDRYTKFLKDFETAIANTKDPALIAGGWREKAKESLVSLQNETDTFHTSKRQYDTLYKNVDIKNDAKIKESLASLYDNFIKNDASYTNSVDPVDQTQLINEVKYLSEKWNAVIDQINGSTSLKFKTSLNCVI